MRNRNQFKGVKVATTVDFVPDKFWLGSYYGGGFQIEFSNDAGDKVTIKLDEDKVLELSRRVDDKVKDIHKMHAEKSKA